jgi:uncharacterized protein YkwD
VRRLVVVVSLGTLFTAGALASAPHHRRHHHRRPHRLTPRRASSLLAVSAAGQTHSPGCADATTSVDAISLDVVRASLLCLINQQRNHRGLPSLSESAPLNQSAQQWTGVMVSTRNFSHGTDFAGRLDAVGYDWQEAGENIASGYMTPQAVVHAWMASADHCRNILTPSFRDVGTGELPAAVGAGSAATWTQDFGLLMSQRPPSTNWGPADGCPY